MANLSQIRRTQMLEFLNTIKEEHKDDDQALKAIYEIENEITSKKYGLVWEEHEENVDKQMETHVPVFTEIKEREIIGDINRENFNFLLEGDNLHSLKLLEKTHKGKIDVIYIDPPYNRGSNDFIYDDNYIEKEDTFKHSKWLSFMSKRLDIARNLLGDAGVIIIHIDENEHLNLLALMNDIFGDQNNLGEIIWNKMNPKGDSQGISSMHETILIFAKNKTCFFELENICLRPKPNAEQIIRKAKSLFSLIGKKAIPTEIANAIKPFNFPKEIKENFYVEYDIKLVNKEFQNWIKNQSFSGGEKAYRFIDENGRVYRGVSMAWPNKKLAPKEYFIPLIHPLTKIECPVPARGWRNPPNTMAKLLRENRILFGVDHNKQPERKYYLDENLYENIPSIYQNADSGDAMLSELNISFEYPKPVSVARYLLKTIHPNPKLILDYFAGSGTTGHAVVNLNKEDGGNRKYILCTNNENNICEDVTYQRLINIQEELPHNLKYYKTDFIPKIRNDEDNVLSDDLLDHIKEMVQLEHGIDIDNEQYHIILTDDDADKMEMEWDKHKKSKGLYISKNVLLTTIQNALFSSVEINTIPDYYFESELREVGEIW